MVSEKYHLRGDGSTGAQYSSLIRTGHEQPEGGERWDMGQLSNHHGYVLSKAWDSKSQTKILQLF
jgi:hypothetical protein